MSEAVQARTLPSTGTPPWVRATTSRSARDAPTRPVSTWRVVGAMALGTLVVLLLVGVVGSLAASRLAGREAVRDAARDTNTLADVVVTPTLTDRLRAGDPASVRAMDRAIRAHVLGPSYVRVKIWTPEGRIVYSDDARLIGSRFDLGEEERAVLRHPITRAEISDLQRPENALERGQGKLLEVYRPVWSPDGSPLLFETYSPYDDVTARAGRMWRGFAGVTLSSLLALILLLAPVVWGLLRRVRQAQQQREMLLQRAVEVSTEERRRIAATLHDGPVQELAAASFVAAGAAEKARTAGQPELADDLKQVSRVVRGGIASMRSLLVDIYPASLSSSGLAVALQDLTTALRGRGIDVDVDLGEAAVAMLDPRQERLVYRVAHEVLLNTMRHAGAHAAWMTLRVQGADLVVLELADDGVGFDAAAVLASPPEGHFGLRLLGDSTSDAGADLLVASAPGAGTRWRLTVPAIEATPAG